MTSIHPLDCESYREEFLVALGSAAGAKGVLAGVAGHGESCGACRTWREKALLTTGILRSMDRLVTPTQLEALIAEDMELGDGALAGVLRSLEPQAAPAELDDLLAQDLAELAGQEPLPEWVSLLEELPRHHAPQVLDRLVDEELANSEQAITKRFVGGLFRRSSPDQLEAHLQKTLVPSAINPIQQLRILQWGSAAAAALVIWVSVPAFQTEATPKFHFEIVEVANLQELSPFARSLAVDLSGGMLNNMQPKATDEESDGGNL